MRAELAKAVRSTLVRIRVQPPYLERGCLEAGNNGAELAMRPIVLGTKNDLFVASKGHGKAATIAVGSTMALSRLYSSELVPG